MFNNLITKFKQRRIIKEFELLELEEMAAHATAEVTVVKAQRALEDAEVRQQRAKDDAQMRRRWESKKLEIQQKYLDARYEGSDSVAEVIPITSTELGKLTAEAAQRMNKDLSAAVSKRSFFARKTGITE